jgi:hypothetical protein
MSGIITDNLGRSSGLVKSASGGTVLSVKSLEVTTTISRSGTTPTQMGDFDMSFAATTSDGKLFFQCWLNTSSDASPTTGFDFYDVTNSAIVGAYADASSSRTRLGWGGFVDNYHRMDLVSFGTWHEPGTTTSRDYTIRGAANSSDTLFINRTGWYQNNATLENAVSASTFTITEYAASAVTLT